MADAYDLPSVKPGELNAPNIRPDPVGTGLESLGQGLQSFGGDVTKIATQIHQEQAAAQATKAEADAQDALDPIMRQALTARSENAFAAAKDAQDALGQLHEKTTAAISDPLAKQMFDKRFGAIRRNYIDQLNAHVAQQSEQVKLDSLDAKAVAAQNAAALPGVDQKQIDIQAALYEGPANALLGATEGAARSQALRAALVETAVKANLERQDQDPMALDKAKTLFYGNREILGAKGVEIEAQIEHAANAQTADAKAMEFIESSRDKNGWVDESKALAGLKDISNVRLKDEVDKRVREQIVLNDAIKKKTVSDNYEIALSAYNKGGWSAANAALLPNGQNAMAWLNTPGNAPEKYQQIKTDSERKSRENKSDAAEQRREQAARNETAKELYLARDPADRVRANIDVEYGAQGLDDVGLSRLKALQQQSKQQLDKGLSQGESEFLRDLMAQGTAIVTAGKSPQDAKAAVQQLRADGTATYLEKSGKKGEPLTDEEQQAIIDAKVSKITKHRPILWDTTEFGYEQSYRLRNQNRGAATAAPASSGVTVIERRKAADGRILEKLSDGSVRVAP